MSKILIFYLLKSKIWKCFQKGGKAISGNEENNKDFKIILFKITFLVLFKFCKSVLV